MTEERKEFCVFAVATALAGGIAIDVALAQAPACQHRRPRWTKPSRYASQEQLREELMA